MNRNSNIFIQENAHENVVCEMASILSQPRVLISHYTHINLYDVNTDACPRLQNHYGNYIKIINRCDIYSCLNFT